MRDRYKSIFLEDVEQKHCEHIEQNKGERMMEGQTRTSIADNDLFDASANTILMLNQVLVELSQLNEKVESLQKSISLKESVSTLSPEKVAENNKRKITLIRDTNGKIVGADVIDVVDINSEKIVENVEEGNK